MTAVLILDALIATSGLGGLVVLLLPYSKAGCDGRRGIAEKPDEVSRAEETIAVGALVRPGCGRFSGCAVQ